jgi:hypothetical protein
MFTCAAKASAKAHPVLTICTESLASGHICGVRTQMPPFLFCSLLLPTDFLPLFGPLLLVLEIYIWLGHVHTPGIVQFLGFACQC